MKSSEEIRNLSLKSSWFKFTTNEIGEKLQKATDKLNDLQAQYKQHITPANFSDYVQLRIQAMRSGQGGCCAFPFWGGNKTSSNPSC